MPDPAPGALKAHSRCYRFADLELDSGQRRVFRDGVPIGLSRLSYEFLRVLVEAAPNLVTHRELALQVWGPRRTVTPENLTQRVLMLRQSLGDDALHPRYIETARSQGCRLIPGVEVVEVDVSARAGIGPARQQAGPMTSAGRLATWLNPRLLGAAIAALVLAAVVLGWSRERAVVATATPVPATAALASDARAILPNSIAVLPFDKLNAEPEAALFLADAMHAELINELGTSADLSVIARASVLHYKDSDRTPRDIADELRVALIVAGSVRYSQDRVHVITELLEATSGVQLWSGDFDAGTADLYSVEHDIAIGISQALSVALPNRSPDDGNDISTSLEAYAFFLRAMDVFNADMPGAHFTAQTLLDEAILLDANFAHAYAGKALIETYAIINSGDDFERSPSSIAEREQRVRDLAAKALALNPQTDLAYYALGILDLFSWRWHQAHENFERALTVNPQHPVFLAQMSWLEVCGMGINEGRRYGQRSVALDPQNPFVHQLYSDVLQCSGDPAAALASTERALEVDPTLFINRMYRAFRIASVRGPDVALAELQKLEPMLTRQRLLSLPAVAFAYRELGRPEDAQRLFDRFVELSDGRRTGPANWYLAYLAVDDFDRAYDVLAQAVESPGPGPGFYTLVSFMNSPGGVAPYNEPRFIELRERLLARLQL